MPERSSRGEVATVRSRSRSRSKPRRPSFPRVKSSQRLIRTISAEFGSTGDVSVVSQDMDHLTLEGGSHEVIEVPFVKATLDSTLPNSYLKQDILNLIQALKIQKWYKKSSGSTLDTESLKITKITGAMTNAIFKVEYAGLPSLLLRIYGPNVESIIDRDYELQVLARLSSHKVGPSLFGCFTNGRFEQFLENSTTLNKNDIRNWRTSQRIARRMKELHVGVPLNSTEIKNGSINWTRIYKWLQKIEQSEWSKKTSNLESVLLSKDWEFFKYSVNKYHEWLDKNRKSSQHLAFCHNDAQYGNLLFTAPVVPLSTTTTSSSISSTAPSLFPTSSNISLDEIIHPSIHEQAQDSKLVVIDFEYSGASPPAYDLANHLSEWMCDYNCSKPYKSNEAKFPNKEEMLNFIYSYVSHKRPTEDRSIDDEVREIYNEIIKERACVSLHWSLWGIIQSGELDAPKDEKTVEEGPGGERYVITVMDEDEVTSIDSSSSIEGVDIDSFENLLYATEKMQLFWGDLVQFGLVSPEELPKSAKLKYLDTKMI